jgi:hypothetical protein
MESFLEKITAMSSWKISMELHLQLFEDLYGIASAVSMRNSKALHLQILFEETHNIT